MSVPIPLHIESKRTRVEAEAEGAGNGGHAGSQARGSDGGAESTEGEHCGAGRSEVGVESWWGERRRGRVRKLWLVRSTGATGWESVWTLCGQPVRSPAVVGVSNTRLRTYDVLEIRPGSLENRVTVRCTFQMSS